MPRPKKKSLDLLAPELMQSDPVMVATDIFGSKLWKDQETIMEFVRDHPMVAWRSCHGIGKTYIVARLVLWFLFSFPYSIVITTAPTWRQVEKLVWKEIRACYSRSKIPLGGNLAPKATELSLVGDEWVATGLSTNDPDRFQGYHAEYLLVVVDEAAGVQEDIFEAIEGVLTSAHCRLILIGNPTNIGGQFYRAFREANWVTGHTSAWDTPNFTELGITRDDIEKDTWEAKVPRKANGDYDWPAPYLITPAWVSDKFKRWKPNHPAYSARVEGEFPEQGEYNVIPLGWIEQAQELWPETEAEDGEPVVIGVDVARGGMDLSAIAVRKGRKVLSIETFASMDGPMLAGEALVRYRKYKATRVCVDIIGVGTSVYDHLKPHADINVQAVNVSAASDVKDEDGNKRYANLRAELWWTTREALDPANQDSLVLPDDEELLADLAAPKYSMRKGWIQIEDKEETKKRLGRSPDSGDALILTFAPVEEVPDVGWGTSRLSGKRK
jgi:hypothetical protein